MNNPSLIVVYMVLMVSSVARAQITASAVERALTDALHLTNIQATLVPGSLHFEQGSARAAKTLLVVERATISRARMEARLRCKPSVSCLPFYVAADLQLEHELTVPRSWSAVTVRNPAQAEAIKAGESVVFVREINGVRILQRALALQRSYAGQMTRVRAIDGRHEVMRGRVTGDHVVRSES